MTLVQLRHLIALAEHGSFSESAERLFLTQPALSRSIRALEDELGQPLFDRIGRRSELTLFGEALVQRARQIVADADELLGHSRRLAGGHAGTLRIGMGSGPGALLMQPLLQIVATEHHPQLRLEISRARTGHLLQALRERSLDALVVDALSLSPAPDLQIRTTYEMRGAFLCRPGHPLLQAYPQGGVPFSAVQRYPIASTPLSDPVARVLMELYGPAAHPLECVSLRCEEVTSLVALTRSTDAVLLAIRAAGAGELVELTMDPPMHSNARFSLVTLARRSPPAELSLVQELMDRLMHDDCPHKT